jgi:uncharacterized protein YggE
VEFRTTELKKHRMLARKEAAKAAREKADVLATELGAKVGAVRTITDYSLMAMVAFVAPCSIGPPLERE